MSLKVRQALRNSESFTLTGDLGLAFSVSQNAAGATVLNIPNVIDHNPYVAGQIYSDAGTWKASTGEIHLLSGDDSTFTSTIGNWLTYAADATVAIEVETGALRIDRSGTSSGITYVPVTTVIGKDYLVSIDHLEEVDLTFGAGNAADDLVVDLGSDSATTVGTYTFTFQATATTTYIKILIPNTETTGLVDNVTCKETYIPA